jgi:HEAT repeat protein
MAIKQQPRELHPNVAKIIAIDRLNLSLPRARKLPAAQVAQLKEVIRGTTVPEGPYSRARALSALVQREQSPEVAALLAQVMANPNETPASRLVAAASLELIPLPEAQDALIAHLDIADPLVRLRVIRSLGVIGDEQALKALERAKVPASDAGRRQLAFSQALIAHRLGQTGRHLRFREGVDRRAKSRKDLIALTLRPIRTATIRTEHKALRGTDFGMRVSTSVGFLLRAGKAQWTVFVNRDLVGLRGFSRMFARPWITALLARYDERTKSTAVQYVVLTDPDEDGARIMVVRPDGELFYTGHATKRGGGLFSFAVLDVERPGTAPTKVTGHLTPKGISLDLTIPFGRRKNKSHGDVVVA